MYVTLFVTIPRLLSAAVCPIEKRRIKFLLYLLHIFLNERNAMRKNCVNGVLLSVVLLLLCTALSEQTAVAGDERNFLWKVQSKTNTVYLLGSVHFMKKEIYPLHKQIEDAFQRADILVVEADINDMSRIDLQKMLGSSFYFEGDSLERHISSETFERVKKAFDEFGMPSLLITRQKPWFLALTLTSLKLAQLGFDPAYGIDVHFLNATSGKKKINELESIDYQIDLLSGFSDGEQEAFLRYTLNDLNSLEKNTDALINAWENGDVRGMESIIEKNIHNDSTAAAMYDKLLYTRNRNMVSKMTEYLQTRETYFVIVGAGHLVGEKGIVEILKKRGYQVRQL
jgi:uncharacterized protein